MLNWNIGLKLTSQTFKKNPVKIENINKNIKPFSCFFLKLQTNICRKKIYRLFWSRVHVSWCLYNSMISLYYYLGKYIDQVNLVFNEGSKERFWEAKSMPLDYVESSVPSNSLRIHGYALLSQRTLNHSWSMQFSWYLNTKCYSEVLVLIVNKQNIYFQLSEYRCRYM